MTTSDIDLQHIEVLWARFKERLSEDSRASIDHFASEHPSSAEEIRKVFPVMRELENLVNTPEGQAIPDSIGRYPIVRCIGTGGMGIVYEAQCDALRERIAIKVISSDRVDPKNVQRFEQEARAVASLHHTHIVPIYEFGHEDGQHFYTMRLVDGPNLADVIRLAELSEKDDFSEFEATDVRAYQLLAKIAGNWGFIADLGYQAALALEHAHSKEVLHRDIKPANLLVDNTDKLWVTDFGLAKRILSTHELTSIFQTVGTPRYMAPEQAKGMPDHRSDVYSLGLTLHEIVTLQAGVKPYKHSGIETPPSPRSINHKVPAELDAIIVKAIRPNPSDRYQSAKELAADFRAFGEKARRFQEQQTHKPNYYWWATALAAVAICFALIWAALQTFSETPENPPIVFRVAEGNVLVGRIPTQSGGTAIAPLETAQLTGPDAKLFRLDPKTGELRSISPLDYEVPLDRDMDNTYEVHLKFAESQARPLVMHILVRDVNEPPQLDRYIFERDQETIHLSGEQLNSAWMMEVDDDRDRLFNGLFFALSGGPDENFVKMTPQGVFVFDPRVGQHAKLDSNQDGVYEIELAISDATQPWMARLEERPGGQIALVKERIVAGAHIESNQISADCLIRRDVIDFATADGKTFFHIHPEPNDKVSLFKSTLSSDGIFESKLLTQDSGLPPETIAIATCDGSLFHCLLRKLGDSQATRLGQFTLKDGGASVGISSLEVVSDDSGIPMSVAGFACLDHSRFHHIRKSATAESSLYFSFLGKRFSNMRLSERETQYVTTIRGQAAWIEREENSQSLQHRIRIDTNPR